MRALCLLLVAASSLVLPIYASAALVTYFQFDGDANDSSGRGNDGVVNGATLTTDRFGRANAAYRFDGINDFIVASASGLPSAERTIAFWFSADSVSNRPVMLGYGGGSCGNSVFIGFNAAPPIYNNSIYVSSHCDVNNLISPYASAPIQDWMHLAITSEASGTRMYLNGDLIASNSVFINNTETLGRALALGVSVAPGGGAPYIDGNIGYFAGAMDDIRIYDTALSAAAIRDLVAGMPPPPQAVPAPPVVLLVLSALAAAFATRRRIAA